MGSLRSCHCSFMLMVSGCLRTVALGMCQVLARLKMPRGMSAVSDKPQLSHAAAPLTCTEFSLNQPFSMV